MFYVSLGENTFIKNTSFSTPIDVRSHKYATFSKHQKLAKSNTIS